MSGSSKCSSGRVECPVDTRQCPVDTCPLVQWTLCKNMLLKDFPGARISARVRRTENYVEDEFVAFLASFTPGFRS
jgi:hypothetical protein